MKKFLYFVATVLSLSVIFGSGWAAGVGKINSKAENVNIRISEPLVEEISEDSENKNCPSDKCPENECPPDEERTEKHLRFRYKIPVPTDFRDRIIKLPHSNG